MSDFPLRKFLTINKNNLFVTMLLIISSLLVFRDVFDININKFIFLAIYIFIIINYKIEYIVYLICFTMPLYGGLPGNWINWCLIIAIVIKSNIKFTRLALIAPLVFIVMELVNGLIYVGNINYNELIKYFSFLLIFFFLAFANYRVDYKKCLKYYVLGTVTLCTVVIFATASEIGLSGVFSGVQRLGPFSSETMSLSINPNELGYYCIFAITSILILKNLKLVNSSLYNFSFILISITGFLTLSKNFVFTFLIAVILYFLLAAKNPTKAIINLFLCGLLFVGLFIGAKLFIPETVDAFVARLTVDDLSNGRRDVFKYYNEFLLNNINHLLFGTGVLNSQVVSGYDLNTHNGIQQIYVAYGIVGFGLFITFIGLAIQKAKNKVKNIPFISYYMFIVLFVVIQATHLIYPATMLLPMLLCLFSIRMFSEKEILVNEA